MRISKITYPAGVNEMLLLSFDDGGRCTARSKDDLVVMGNFTPASHVASLGARLHPVNERDQQLMLQGLTEWREYLERLLDTYCPPRPSAQLRQERKDWQRGVKRIDAEIKRLTNNGTLARESAKK